MEGIPESDPFANFTDRKRGRPEQALSFADPAGGDPLPGGERVGSAELTVNARGTASPNLGKTCDGELPGKMVDGILLHAAKRSRAGGWRMRGTREAHPNFMQQERDQLGGHWPWQRGAQEPLNYVSREARKGITRVLEMPCDNPLEPRPGTIMPEHAACQRITGVVGNLVDQRRGSRMTRDDMCSPHQKRALGGGLINDLMPPRQQEPVVWMELAPDTVHPQPARTGETPEEHAAFHTCTHAMLTGAELVRVCKHQRRACPANLSIFHFESYIHVLEI